MCIERPEAHRNRDILIMLVDQQLRDRLESHCLVDEYLNADERLENILKLIHVQKKRRIPTKQKISEIYKEGEQIVEFAIDQRDTLYKAWQGMPRDHLEELLIAVLFFLFCKNKKEQMLFLLFFSKIANFVMK